MRNKGEVGSAVIEFLGFTLIGQLLILTGSIQIASSLDLKLKLELMAHQVARAEAIGKGAEVFTALRLEYRLPKATFSKMSCTSNVVCVKILEGNNQAIGVSLNV